MIQCSAIKIGRKVYLGRTHREIILDLVTNKRCKLPIDGEQGFVNDQGVFLSREDAALEALSSGQIQKLGFCSTRLFSEDLYNAGDFNYKLLRFEPSLKKDSD